MCYYQINIPYFLDIFSQRAEKTWTFIFVGYKIYFREIKFVSPNKLYVSQINSQALLSRCVRAM